MFKKFPMPLSSTLPVLPEQLDTPPTIAHNASGEVALMCAVLSMAEKVVRESFCPGFTTREVEGLSTTQPFRRVLVPIDIHERSLAALTYARHLAQENGGTVYHLHVVPTEEIYLRRVVPTGRARWAL